MGDEGKGRLVYEIIDELKEKASRKQLPLAVVKVNGGANSGHTAAGLKLNLLPSGIVDNDIRYLIIGSGVVADPHKLHWESIPLEKKGFSVYSRLLIDEKTMVSDLTHRLLDLAWETYRVHQLHEPARGSTGRGISPAYCEEVNHFQITYADFKGTYSSFAKKMEQRIDRNMSTIEHVCKVTEEQWHAFFTTIIHAEIRANDAALKEGIFTENEFDFKKFMGPKPFTLNLATFCESYWKAGTSLLKQITDIREVILDILSQQGCIVGEFGQSYWLDKRHGFSPNVTASHTYTPEFFNSVGIPLQPIHTLGATKCYDTKVGTHLFLSEMNYEHPLAKKLRQMEFGTSTGRQRMVGWYDAVEKGDALRYGGFQDIAINKLDALTYSDDWQGGELLICTAYKGPDGKLYNHVPRDEHLRTQLKPVYFQLPGWNEDISQIRSFEILPKNAKRYIASLMHFTIAVTTRNGMTSTPLPNLRYIGVGPDPKQVIRDIPSTEKLLKYL